ncbi:MAG TPA: hypothetical protein VJ227_01855 [Patescibacteria group bacterium]|nr:hypothetical protein [Patescibacteria group bacterium]
MAERLFFRGREKKLGPSIRYHHLDLWGDFVKDYIKHFDGKKPWEMTSEEFDAVEPFIRVYLGKEMKSEIAAKSKFEHAILDNRDMRQDYRYLVDLLGNNEDRYEQVLSRRIAYFSHIVDIAHLSEDLPVALLWETPDEYCDSCAIGKHCKVPVWRSFLPTRDTVYRRVLGRKSITTSELFDPEFYETIKLESKRGFLSWF